MQKILSIGHTTLDTFVRVDKSNVLNSEDEVCFKAGDKIPVDSIHHNIGGGATNVAVGVSRLGVQSSIYSHVGKDDQGKNVRRKFEEDGIDTKYLFEDGQATDQAYVISYSNDRTIFTYSTGREYDLTQVEASSFKHIFLSSIGGDVSQLYDDIRELKKRYPSKVIFFNPGSKEIRDYSDDIMSLLPFVDYLIVNVDEACSILSQGLSRENIEIDDLMNLLMDKGALNVVLTDGENGAHIMSKDETLHIPAIKTEVVEMTGAGDAFTSGLITGSVSGKNLKESAEWGTIMASSVIGKVGAHIGLLTRKELTAKHRDF